MPTATAESLAETTPAPVGVETPVQAWKAQPSLSKERSRSPKSRWLRTQSNPVSSQTQAPSLTSASGIDGNALQLQAKRRAHDQQIVLKPINFDCPTREQASPPCSAETHQRKPRSMRPWAGWPLIKKPTVRGMPLSTARAAKHER